MSTESRRVVHPQLGPGEVLKTYMGGYEWEVRFDSGRRFRLPAREFDGAAADTWQPRGVAAPTITPRVPLLEVDQFRARQTLEALRLGIVPVQDVETLTIGLEPERVSLQRALERTREHGGDVQAIVGDYGFGKSHFVELAARRGLREQFVVSTASLDLVEVPPGKANEIYRTLVRSMRYPDTEERGLRPLIQKALDRPGLAQEFIALSPRGTDCPFAAALQALENCPSQIAYDDIVLWLSGQIKPTAELRTCLRRPPRLYLAGDIARQYVYLLTAISVLAHMAGYSGLTVLIDESEHYSLLRANQRQRADAFFKALIYAALGRGSRVDATTIPDHARVEYPVSFATNSHLFFLFALTESENRMPIDVWLHPAQIVRLDDRFIERDIQEFFTTLLRYHSLAYGCPFPPTDERYGLLAQGAPPLLARALSQHRINVREVIRLAVTLCDMLYLHPSYTVDTLLGELKEGLRL